MKRIRLLIETNFHPEVGAHRMGEVFDASDALGTHWVNQSIAEYAAGEAISAPREIPANEEEPWDVTPLDEDDPLASALVNGQRHSRVSTRGMKARRQRRGR